MTVDRAPLSWHRWLTAPAIGLGGALAYLVLPAFAPVDLQGQTDALLLGVLLGLVVGVALRVGPRLAPALAVGAFIGFVVRFSVLEPRDHYAAVYVVVVGLVIAVEIWAIPVLLRRAGACGLDAPAELARYLGVVLAVTLAAGAVIGVLAVAGELPIENATSAWRSWALDDVFGLVCITPAVITLRRPTAWTWSRAFEFGVALAYTVATTYYVFFVVTPGQQGLLGWPYIVLLGPGWIAVRLGVQAVAPVLAVQLWVAVTATANGTGAFSQAAPDALDRVLAAEAFAIFMSAMIIALGVQRDAHLRAEASARLLSEVVDGSDALIFAKSFEGEDAPRGRYLLVNRKWSGTTGVDEERTLDHSDLDIFPEDIAEAFVANDHIVMAANEPLGVREMSFDTAGDLRTYWSWKFPLRAANGRPWGVGGIASDITEIVRAQERESRQSSLLRAIFEHSPTPAVRLSLSHDGGLEVLDANAAMCSLLASDPDDVVHRDLMERVDIEDRSTAWEAITHCIELQEVSGRNPSRPREIRMHSLDGRVAWVVMSTAAVGRVSEPAVAEIVAQFEDVTARRQAEEALSNQAMRDVVTGLPNRRALHERMHTALQRLRRHPGTVTVIYCDLDRFKEINDSLGHQVGDLMLVEVAARLRGALRPEDTIARLGGDEFVALCEGLDDVMDAQFVAMRMQDRLVAPWIHEGQLFHPEASIGIAATADADISVDEILRRADLAMYRAKEAGRNRIEVYERSVDEEIQQAVALQHDLRAAIDSDALFVLYQPIVDLSDGAIVGAEALVRMRGGDGSVLTPACFVPQAEVSGLVVPMGAWVLQRTLTDLRSWRDRGRMLTMSVNVSPSQLRDPGFATYLLEQARLAQVDPAWLSVEVTETALIHDPGRSSEELVQLSRAGVGISLDDFGTGYSSLAWLTQFPVSTVKIDKSFTDEVGLDNRKSAIVSAVIQVSHELGFTVVAEGIESEDQRIRLVELGCDRGQGYLFGRPLPIDDPIWA